MSTRIEQVVHLIDDLDGGKAARTVTFALDGKGYEIDLSARNLKGLEKALKPYLDAARPVKRSGSSKRKPAKAKGPALADVRQWAHEQGMDVNGRGRIPVAVVEAYQAAH